MQFPGLDLSSIAASDRIVTAYLKVKDVLQTQTGVQVDCYVFGGNTWTESTAKWNNVSPNEIRTLLGSNTISYGSGETKSPKHTYTFNITKAVMETLLPIVKENLAVLL